MRVTFWGALAMGITAGVGALVGTSVCPVNTALALRIAAWNAASLVQNTRG
jgi:hypothetical protein